MPRNLLNLLTSKECFISHCSSDEKIMNYFSSLVEKYYNNLLFFNTYNEEHSTNAGEERSEAIKSHLKKSSLMISIITDNYTRSIICVSELSAFWYSSKPVIPIVFNGDIGIKFLWDLFGTDIIYVDTNTSPKDCAKKFVNSMSNYGYEIKNSLKTKALNDFMNFFKKVKQTKSERSFIGCGEEFDKILSYCENYGVHQIKNSSLSTDEFKKNLSDKDEILMLSTTGSTLIGNLSSEFLPKAIANGTNFTLLLPNKFSNYIMDVAEIEMPNDIRGNVNRLSGEFNNVMLNLYNVANRSKALAKDKTKLGHIYVGCSFTLLRQTVTLGKKGDNIWGWTSLTIPPKKTNDGTPSLEFSGSVSESSMAKIMYEHICAIIDIARKRDNTWLEILPDTDINKIHFGLEKFSAKNEWQNMFDKAKDNTEKHYNQKNNLILIEVAAQHPLENDGSPGKEFKNRLDKAAELYHSLVSKGKCVHIYVPGSVHVYRGHTDPISLSQSGTNYLKDIGINEDSLIGEAANEKYKGSKGVYNSADECFVASKIFDDGKYQQIYCVCSPNQMMRKQLFYTAFGVLPMFVTVPCENMAHNLIYEIFEALPDVILSDQTWQSEDSKNGNRTRQERMPVNTNNNSLNETITD